MTGFPLTFKDTLIDITLDNKLFLAASCVERNAQSSEVQLLLESLFIHEFPLECTVLTRFRLGCKLEKEQYIKGTQKLGDIAVDCYSLFYSSFIILN